MKHPDASYVIKYFDLVDEFIRIRCCTDDVLTDLHRLQVHNKATYRTRIVEACVPEYLTEILTAVAKLDEEYDQEIVEELLYQICIDVNPSLEIHQVSIPAPAAAGTANQGSEPMLAACGAEQRQMFRKVLGLERALKAQVIGQDDAVHCLSRAIKKAAVGLQRPDTPVGTFLLVGRTGTGKTELAKALSRCMFEDTGRLVRIDCSEYALPHEYAKLIGSPPGYIGHNEGGYLTETVKKKPQCIVLFDEIEKAHQKVHNLLLQVLDEGVLTDSKGQVIDFQQTVVIMTSNLGVAEVDAIRTRMGFSKKHQEQSLADMDLKEPTVDALKTYFRPEFVNRIDEVVVFNPLDEKVCCRIAARMLREVADLLARTGIKVRYSSSVRNVLAKQGFSEEFGARELKRLIKRKIEDPITELILDEELGPGAEIDVRVRGGEPVVTLLTPGNGSLTAARLAHVD